MEEVHPAEHIKVGFDQNYVNACRTYSSPSLHIHWDQLGKMLGHREGWHCDVVNSNQLLWSFGTFGKSLLSIEVVDNGIFACFDYYEDQVISQTSVQEVHDWVNSRETSVRETDLEDSKKFLSASNWHGLRNLPFEIDIDFIEANYVGVIRQSEHEPTFGRNLIEVIRNSKEMIATYFGADFSLIDSINVKCHLSEAATKNFLVQNT